MVRTTTRTRADPRRNGGALGGGDGAVEALAGQRPTETLVEPDLRLPPENLLRPGDVRLAHLRIVNRQRLEDNLALEPVARMTASASSSSVISFGFPMLTGRCSPLVASRKSPRIRSST